MQLTTSLGVGQVALDEALRCRVALDREAVADYRAVLDDGGTLPPVDVHEVDGRLLLVDGWHRFAAHTQAGRDCIDAYVTTGGGYFEALLAAAQANHTHGVRMSNADKRRTADLLLSRPETADWSDRQIAQAARVSHTFVAQRRRAAEVKPGDGLKQSGEQQATTDGSTTRGPTSAPRSQIATPGSGGTLLPTRQAQIRAVVRCVVAFKAGATAAEILSAERVSREDALKVLSKADVLAAFGWL